MSQGLNARKVYFSLVHCVTTHTEWALCLCSLLRTQPPTALWLLHLHFLASRGKEGEGLVETLYLPDLGVVSSPSPHALPAVTQSRGYV